jgi:predicted PurR-regulated permease PerM
MSYYKKRRKRDVVAALLIVTTILAVGIAVGVAIGWSAARKSIDDNQWLNKDEDVSITAKMFQEINTDNIRGLLRCVFC